MLVSTGGSQVAVIRGLPNRTPDLLLIVGAGGHGKVVADIAMSAGHG